jgi:hypothetical protein
MIDVKVYLLPTSGIATNKLSAVGAGHARDEAAKALQMLPKCRGRGLLLRCQCA